ncbi:MAG: cytochrome c biogenesis protein CcdA [Clostridiales bacterium]|nr:cytochrome c biogenesis protein CcdA [Clostridiales bacterium]
MGILGVSEGTAVLQGLLSFFSPCVLPLLPVYLSILGMGASGDRKKGWLFYNGLLFCIGLSAVFIALGAVATGLGQFLVKNLDVICKIAGALAVIMGLLTIFSHKIPFFNREKRLEVDRAPGLVTSLLMGMAFGFGWVPCISAPLTSILLLASASATMARGIWLLVCYSLGFCVPFLFCAAFAGVMLRKVQVLKKYAGAIRIASGVLMILMGILLFSGMLSQLIV